MATENTQPEEVVTPEPPMSIIPDAPVVEGGVEVYNSSEEFQRAHKQGLAQQKVEEERQKATTEKQKIKAVLDKYIAKYGDISEVRKMAKAGKKSADHQLDVNAEVIETLRKIKNELR